VKLWKIKQENNLLIKDKVLIDHVKEKIQVKKVNQNQEQEKIISSLKRVND